MKKAIALCALVVSLLEPALAAQGFAQKAAGQAPNPLIEEMISRIWSEPVAGRSSVQRRVFVQGCLKRLHGSAASLRKAYRPALSERLAAFLLL
ncbi:MAG: hypothetical protein OHK006_12090 [Thermodesulfovibrionales bacterium]